MHLNCLCTHSSRPFWMLPLLPVLNAALRCAEHWSHSTFGSARCIQFSRPGLTGHLFMQVQGKNKCTSPKVSTCTTNCATKCATETMQPCFAARSSTLLARGTPFPLDPRQQEARHQSNVCTKSMQTWLSRARFMRCMDTKKAGTLRTGGWLWMQACATQTIPCCAASHDSYSILKRKEKLINGH